MAEDDQEEGVMVVPIVVYMGRDDRQWRVFWMSPMAQEEGEEDAPRIIVRIRLPEKTLELVQQAVAMEVFVNPDPQGFDEWEVDGKRLFIMSPQPGERRAEVAVRGG